MEYTRPVFSRETIAAINKVLEKEDQERRVVTPLDQLSTTIDGNTRILTCETIYVGRKSRFVPIENLPYSTIFCKTFICFGAIKYEKLRVEADTIILADANLKQTDTIDLIAKKTLLLINCNRSSWKCRATFEPTPIELTHTVTQTPYVLLITATKKFAQYLFPEKTELPPIEAAIRYLKKVCSTPQVPQEEIAQSEDVGLIDLGQYSAPNHEQAEAHFRKVSEYGSQVFSIDFSAVTRLAPCCARDKKPLTFFYKTWVSMTNIPPEAQDGSPSGGERRCFKTTMDGCEALELTERLFRYTGRS